VVVLNLLWATDKDLSGFYVHRMTWFWNKWISWARN